MNKKLKQDKAITLIALVITVIIIVILAGVSINLVLGENGIVNKAKEAATMHSNAAAEEKMELLVAELELNKDYRNGTSLKDVLDNLKDKNSSITDVKEIDDNNAEVTIDDKYIFLVKTDDDGKIDVVPQGQASGITLSSTKGTIYYPGTTTITFDVLKNESGGKLSVESQNSNIATASISGTKVTVQAKGSYGVAKIVVKSQANAGYAEGIATYEVTVENRSITLSATAYSGTYDGKAHNAITSVNVTPSDAKIEYSVDGGAYSTTIPQVTNATSYTISIRASKEGYTTKEITKTVTIGTVSSATASGVTKTYTGSAQTGVSGSNVDWTGTTSATAAGTYTAYATPKANYTWSDGTTAKKTITWEIKKAAGKLTLEKTATTINCDHGENITINNASGGTLSVSNSNESVASVRISGTELVISGRGTEPGTTTITVTSAATANYEAATAKITVTIRGKLSVTATGATGEYGPATGYRITVTCNTEGATITYATSQNGTYSTTNPSYSTAGTYKTYYKVEKEGYSTVTGYQTVTINKTTITPTLQGVSGNSISIQTGAKTFYIGLPAFVSSDYISINYDSTHLNVTQEGTKLTISAKAMGKTSTLRISIASSDNWYSDYSSYQVSTTY